MKNHSILQTNPCVATGKRGRARRMAELVPGGVAFFFAFGYFGYLWTYSYVWPLGIILATYVLSISFALQEFTVFDVYIELPTAAELGVTLAWLVANASLLPPLVPRLAYLVQWRVVPPANDDEDEDYDDDIGGGVRVETFPLQASAISGAVFLVNGALTLIGIYGHNLTFVEQLIYGIPEIIVGVGLLIYGLGGLALSRRRLERADCRYILYLYLFVILPPLAYNGSRLLFRPFEIVPLWVFFLGLTTLVTIGEITLLGVRADAPTMPLEGDPRYTRAERYPVRIVQRWVLVTMLPPLSIYTVCWVVEDFVDGTTTGDSLGAAAAATVVMGIVSLFFGGLSSPTRANGYFPAQPGQEAGTDLESVQSRTRHESRTQSSPPAPEPRRTTKRLGVDLGGSSRRSRR